MSGHPCEQPECCPPPIGQPVDTSGGTVLRLPVPSRAFVPFPSDVEQARARVHRAGPDHADTVTLTVIGQALEEIGRLHETCPERGRTCDVCWWLSRALAAGRAGGWL